MAPAPVRGCLNDKWTWDFLCILLYFFHLCEYLSSFGFFELLGFEVWLPSLILENLSLFDQVFLFPILFIYCLRDSNYTVSAFMIISKISWIFWFFSHFFFFLFLNKNISLSSSPVIVYFMSTSLPMMIYS